MYTRINHGQYNLFIMKSVFKIIIHVLKLLKKNFESFNSKRKAHGKF